ncbi:MAG: hypothetical protein JWO11_4145 [Nocardioides sp.]|nr:hypothetical protein [Nocardioides sp.]
MTTPPGLLDAPSVIRGRDGALAWIPGSLPVPVPENAATMTVAEWLGINTN